MITNCRINKLTQMLTLMMQLLSLSANINNQQYSIRSFNKVEDQAALEEICANVWDGTDYLPSTFKTYCDDPDCAFLALTDHEEDIPLAVSNYRRIGKDIAWFEAIRTAEDARGKGYARSLLQQMIATAKQEGRDSLSCTVASNIPMIKVFQKCGMRFLCKLNMIDFSTCKNIPGWKNDRHDGLKENGKKLKPQNLISALSAEKCIRENARNPQKITPITTQLELDDALQRIYELGGTKFVPGLFSILSPSQLSSSIDKRLVFLIETSGDDDGIALLVLSRDERISSLKSNWICSISTNSHLALEAAAWYACFSPDVQDNLDGHVAFCLVFNDYDTAGSDEESDFIHALPLAKDPCVLYGI